MHAWLASMLISLPSVMGYSHDSSMHVRTNYKRQPNLKHSCHSSHGGSLKHLSYIQDEVLEDLSYIQDTSGGYVEKKKKRMNVC